MTHSPAVKRPGLSTFAAVLLLASAPVAAQTPAPAAAAPAGQAVKAPKAPAASPLQMAAKKLDANTYVKLTYSSPRRADPKSGQTREVFGKLVPYGQVWRLGANEATELTTTGDITLAGKPLPAGTYSVYAIPQADKWTLIVNKDLGAWGAYKYDQAKDVLRVDVPAKKGAEAYEAFTIAFDEKGTALNMAWDTTQVSVPVAVAGKKS
jgi:hypothetical protein